MPGLPAGFSKLRHADEAFEVVNGTIKGTHASRELAKVSSASSKYSDVASPKNAGAGKRFTQRQKREILEANMEATGGVLKSDGDGRLLSFPSKNVKGQKVDMNQAEVDHINPRSAGGSNHTSNAQVLSKEENLKKSNKR